MRYSKPFLVETGIDEISLEHAQTRLREFWLNSEYVQKAFPSFQGIVPEFYLRSLDIYIKHGEPGLSPISKGMEGEPVFLMDFTSDLIYENLKTLQANKTLWNPLEESHLVYGNETEKVLLSKRKIIDDAVKAEKTKAANEACRISKLKQAERFKEKEKQKEAANEARRISKLKQAERFKEKEKQKKQDFENRIVEFKKLGLDETLSPAEHLELARAQLSDLSFNDKKKLEKAEQLNIQDLFQNYRSSDLQASSFGFRESDMEDTIIMNKKAYGLKGWYLLYRQYSLSKLGRIDLIYRSAEGKINVIELQRREVTKDHFSKSRIYRRQLHKDLNVPLEDIIITLMANTVDETIKEECAELNMELFIKSEADTRALIDKLPKREVNIFRVAETYTPPTTPPTPSAAYNYFNKPWYAKNR
jgi:RecB family endonuclease NucS